MKVKAELKITDINDSNNTCFIEVGSNQQAANLMKLLTGKPFDVRYWPSKDGGVNYVSPL